MPYAFAGYAFGPESGLRWAGQDIPLPPKERELLHFLLLAGGKVVAKDAVVNAVWHGGIASDESISRAVYRLRLAMQAAGGPPVVTTVYNGGFRISAPIVLRAGPATGAWLLVQSGREFAARLTAPDIAIALEAAHCAAALDPASIAAWIAIAEFHVLQIMRALVPARHTGQQACAAAARALALEPACARALAARGWVRALVEGALQSGLADLDQALALDPRRAGIPLLRAGVLQAIGRTADAVEMAGCSQRLNPFNLFAVAALPRYLMYVGRTADALDEARAQVQRFPGLDGVHEILSVLLSAGGRLDEALRHARQAVLLGQGAPLLLGQLAYVLARMRRTDEVHEVMQRLNEQPQPLPFACVAAIQWAQGERRLALQSLQTAKALGLPQFFSMRDDPRLSGCAADPEIGKLWRQV